MPHALRSLLVAALLTHSLPAAPSHADGSAAQALRAALTLHAPFDGAPDAAFARGDARLWQAPTIPQRDAAELGLPADGNVALAAAGHFGGALQFRGDDGPIVFFRAADNLPALRPGWSASAAFWLSTDPEGQLKPGFCDPLQITSKQWDDAALFVEFEKRPAGIPFRLGVYADKQVWNPTGRPFEEIPPAERPLVAVDHPPFAAARWTHVAVTWEGFNTGAATGVARLYLNGQAAGTISDRVQTFTWDADRAAVMLGLGYVGLMDDLALFDRALSAEEVAALYHLPEGVAGLPPAQ